MTDSALLHAIVYTLIAITASVSYVFKKLTFAGGILAFVVASCVFIGCSYRGIVMLGLFFLAGTIATSWQCKTKQALELKDINLEGRTAGQVFANGGVAAITGLFAWLCPHYLPLFQFMMAGSMAAATADTLSSELGSVYGKRFYDVISFKCAQPGPDGVISLEGTILGLAGAALIATVYIFESGGPVTLLVIITSGAIGNLADSVLGATLERKRWIGKNMVNFLNTLTGAIVCLLLSRL